MGKDKRKEEIAMCPVGRFFADLERVSGEKSRFFEHLNNSRIEFLKAVRSLLDERIEAIEQKGREKKKATKIKID